VIWLSLSFFIITIVGQEGAASISHLQRIFIKNHFLPFIICNVFPKSISGFRLSTAMTSLG
jgi:hypothetical protein